MPKVRQSWIESEIKKVVKENTNNTSQKIKGKKVKCNKEKKMNEKRHKTNKVMNKNRRITGRINKQKKKSNDLHRCKNR